VLALQPGHAPAHYLLGIVLRDSGDPDGARREFASAIGVAPGFVEARIAAAKAAQEAGDAPAAAIVCAEGLAAVAEPLPLLRALGLALLAAATGRRSTPARAFARSVDGETHYNRGVALHAAPRSRCRAPISVSRLADLTAADFNLGRRSASWRHRRRSAYENVIRRNLKRRRVPVSAALLGAGRIVYGSQFPV
jgi:hypothetical protein